VAERASLDQRRDDGAAERAGPAGDDDMTIAEIHIGQIPLRHHRRSAV
jgi:hypothetical protein